MFTKFINFTHKTITFTFCSAEPSPLDPCPSLYVINDIHSFLNVISLTEKALSDLTYPYSFLVVFKCLTLNTRNLKNQLPVANFISRFLIAKHSIKTYLTN